MGDYPFLRREDPRGTPGILCFANVNSAPHSKLSRNCSGGLRPPGLGTSTSLRLALIERRYIFERVPRFSRAHRQPSFDSVRHRRSSPAKDARASFGASCVDQLRAVSGPQGLRSRASSSAK